MQSNIQAGNDCKQCCAPCCTDKHNSMHITSEEAQDIATYVHACAPAQQEIFRTRMLQAIERYRLDRLLYIKPGLLLRRRYTCPFFLDQHLGCSLPFEVKPLGCIHFNPTIPHQTEGGQCKPLVDTTTYIDESQERLPIPVAVMRVF